MKILFVYTNINGFHYDNYHFGVGSLVQTAIDLGHDVNVKILLTKDEYSEFENEILENTPDLIGFTAVSSQFSHIKELSIIAKNISKDIITICGGVHPTLAPEEILNSKDLDCFIRGEGELAFTEFLRRIEAGEDYFDSPNLCFEKEGKLVKNELLPLVENLDELPIPNKTTFPYYESSILRTKTAPFFFTRGCPFTCTYCFNQYWANIYGRSRNYPRFRSAEICIQEIEQVVSKHHKEIEFLFVGDDIFGANGKWRKEFCEKYHERIFKKYDMKYMILLRVEMCTTDKLLKMLKDSGCFRIFFGVESGDEEQRTDVLDRKMSDATIIQAFEMCRKMGLETLAVNIIGFPDETEEMIKRTVKLNQILKPTTSAVNVFYPYQGTELGDKCFKENLVDLKRFENFDNERRESILNFSEDHHKMIMSYYNKWSKLVQPIWAKQRFMPALRDLLFKIHLLGLAKLTRSLIRSKTFQQWFKPGWFRPGRAA